MVVTRRVYLRFRHAFAQKSKPTMDAGGYESDHAGPITARRPRGARCEARRRREGRRSESRVEEFRKDMTQRLAELGRRASAARSPTMCRRELLLSARWTMVGIWLGLAAIFIESRSGRKLPWVSTPRWPRKNDSESIRARQDELRTRTEDGESLDDLQPLEWTEALTGVAVVPVAVVGPLRIALGVRADGAGRQGRGTLARAGGRLRPAGQYRGRA